MTGIVDYNAGNIRSVEHALDAIRAPFVLSKKPEELSQCDRLIFPGVGDASYAMKQLKQTGFDTFLKDWTAAGKPLMGICLGSQIIFDHSDEGDAACLGLIKGNIRHFSDIWKEHSLNTGGVLKVPHMGWNDIAYDNGGSALLDGVPEHSDFYFVHSYVIQPDDPAVVKAYADYGIRVPAVIESGCVSAFQFHPEKSGTRGMRILRNFCSQDITEGGAVC
jgi:imidazole glycerol phosphate synthase, glutamine amidotransferase subunit